MATKAAEEEEDDSTETEATDAAAEQDDEESEAPDLASESGGFMCTAEQRVLKGYFETFDTIVDEMKLHIDQEGFYGKAVDPANVAMAEDDLDQAAFEHYSSTGGLIGLNLGRMIDILKLGDADDLVQFELDQETRKLEINIDGLEYTLALIDPDSIRAEPDIPDLDLPTEAILEGSDLARGIKGADMVSDHIRFHVDESGDDPVFVIEAQGDTDDVVITLEEDDLIDLTVGDGDSLFSLDYLKDLNKAIPKNAEVRIRLGSEFPVKIHYDHIEVDDEHHASVTMMLAPRIQSD